MKKKDTPTEPRLIATARYPASTASSASTFTKIPCVAKTMTAATNRIPVSEGNLVCRAAAAWAGLTGTAPTGHLRCVRASGRHGSARGWRRTWRAAAPEGAGVQNRCRSGLGRRAGPVWRATRTVTYPGRGVPPAVAG
ncbi:hypothetical protein GCM10010452_38290 [Crossiella cryophila]